MKKLRTYKGFVFDPAIMEWRAGEWRYETAASAVESPYNRLSDYDHAELMRLKAEPYEPVPRLEDVVRNWTAKQIEKGVSHLPLSSLNYIELVRDIRTAFPHIDQEER